MTTPPPTPPQPPQQPPQQPPYGGGQGPQAMSPSDEKLWATLVHVGGIILGFVSPLIGYLVLKDRGPFVREHTKRALNFQLTLLIAEVVGYILLVVVIGGLILLAVGVVNIIFSIIAAMKANKGEWYTYPMSIPFIK